MLPEESDHSCRVDDSSIQNYFRLVLINVHKISEEAANDWVQNHDGRGPKRGRMSQGLLNAYLFVIRFNDDVVQVTRAISCQGAIVSSRGRISVQESVAGFPGQVPDCYVVDAALRSNLEFNPMSKEVSESTSLTTQCEKLARLWIPTKECRLRCRRSFC